MSNNGYNNRDRDNLTSINSYNSGKKTLTIKDLKLTEKRTNYVKPSNEAEGLGSEIGKNLDELELKEDPISSPSDLEYSFIYSIPLNNVGQLQLYTGVGFRIIKQINYSPIVSNDSIGGSCVADYGIEDDNHHTGKKWCMNNQTRINDLGDSSTSSSNHPNVIMFFGGTNDICQSGVFKNEDFINSYSNAVRMMYERYSNSITVLCITPYSNSYLTTNAESGNDVRFGQVCAGIALVVNHYKAEGRRCKLVSLQDINLVEGIDANVGHPTASGMHTIADRVAYVYKNS